MQKQKSKMPALTILMTLCYMIFLVMDFRLKVKPFSSSIMKYTAIWLCFFLALEIYRKSLKQEGDKALLWAILLTLGADLFLLFPVTKPAALNYAIGIVFFCFAHLAHRKRFGKPIGIFKYTLFILCIFLLAFVIKPNILPEKFLLAGVILYAVLMTLNLKAAFQLKWDKQNKKLAVAGMILFLCCDICILIYHVFLYAVGMKLPAWAVNLSWVFYLPSQYLLVMSGFRFEQKSNYFHKNGK